MVRRDSTRATVPLADMSVGGRLFRTAQKKVEIFGKKLSRGVEEEMNHLKDKDQKTGLSQARERLHEGIKQLTVTAEAIPDRRLGAMVLTVGLDLMFACADTAS